MMRTTRAGRTGLVGLVASVTLGVVAAYVAVRDNYGDPVAVARTLPVTLFWVGVAFSVLFVGIVVHVWRRDDLARHGKLIWTGGLVLLGPLAAVAYVVLGRDGSRRLADRLLDRRDAAADDGGAA